MDQESIKYLNRYINVTEEIKHKIERDAKKYGIKAEICAWYQDLDDFYSDWCGDIGYTKTQARKLLYGGIGEFMRLSNGMGIIRFAI